MKNKILLLTLFCLSMNSAFAIDCSEEQVTNSGDDSPNKAHFEEVLKKGMKAPLRDFLKLWYPVKRREITRTDAYFFKCQDKAWARLETDFRTDILKEECSPDVVYSWGNKEKLEVMKASMPNDGVWTGSPNPEKENVFTAITPATTYAYGPIQVRFKIKKGTTFIEKYFSSGPNVIVNTSMFQEFILRHGEVIESWSYGTPEQYDETIKDIVRISSGKRAQAYYVYQKPRGFGIHRFLSKLADGLVDNKQMLKKHLLEMIRMILNKEGRIHYSQNSCHNRSNFFATDKPTYFNPN